MTPLLNGSNEHLAFCKGKPALQNDQAQTRVQQW